MPEPRNFRAVTETDQHTQLLARPSDWSKGAQCLDQWVLFDADHLKEGVAATLCAACPVIAECLSAAVVEEGSLIARNRYGVRGGLSPDERAALALKERVCSNGHEGEWTWQENEGGRAHWACAECLRESKRAYFRKNKESRLEYQRHYRSKRKVRCPMCEKEMHKVSLNKHVERMHTEDGAQRAAQKAGRAA